MYPVNFRCMTHIFVIQLIFKNFKILWDEQDLISKIIELSESVLSMLWKIHALLWVLLTFYWVPNHPKMFLKHSLTKKQKVIFRLKKFFFIEISDPPGPFRIVDLSSFWLNLADSCDFEAPHSLGNLFVDILIVFIV